MRRRMPKLAAPLVAAALAITGGVVGARAFADDPLDPAHNAALPCEFVGAPHLVPRSAKNIAHIANVCGIVGTDIEFQSRTDAFGKTHDFAFVGTMGQGTRILDVTDPSHPFQVGGYTDPGWQNDVSVRGDTLTVAFDPLVIGPYVSDCIRQKNVTGSITRGGFDAVRLEYVPLLNRFLTHRYGCHLVTNSGDGAHTITLHPSGDWVAVNTTRTGVEVVDLRGDQVALKGKITSATTGSGHDTSFSADGNTMYAASPGQGTYIVDVTGVLDKLPATQPTRLALIPNNHVQPSGSSNRYNLTTSHQADTTSDGKIFIFTDERGGGLSQTACNTSPTGIIGGAHFYALAPIEGRPETEGASPATPKRLGTWFYPNPLLAVDALDEVLASRGRTERACTIHVFRAGGNGSAGPGEVAPGFDGVSRLPVDQIVSAHYGAGVWWIDVDEPPNSDDGTTDDQFTTWGNTLGWNVMPGADTWSAKEYKGYIFTGDMTRGFDVFSFTPCEGLGCVVVPSNIPGSASGGGNMDEVPGEITISKGTSVGGKATFGFDAEYRIGQIAPTGSLSFTDHGLKLTVEATVIDSFHVAQGTATFTGRATVDGMPGVPFEVTVKDNGEPGRGLDTFQLFLATGYLAAGTLDGGNIEVESDPRSIFGTAG